MRCSKGLCQNTSVKLAVLSKRSLKEQKFLSTAELRWRLLRQQRLQKNPRLQLKSHLLKITKWQIGAIVGSTSKSIFYSILIGSNIWN